MRILLDTHVAIWAIFDSRRIPTNVRDALEDIGNEVLYSIVSVWEIEIKHLAHPDNMPIDASEFVTQCRASDFNELPLLKEHIYRLRDLRRAEDAHPHKDPFDRILLCQSLSEGATFVTHDSALKGYDLPGLRFI